MGTAAMSSVTALLVPAVDETEFADRTTLVAALVAVVEPALLVAVCRTRSVAPASALTGEYVDDVAPEMSLQLLPSVERCHCHARVGVEPLVQVGAVAVSVCPTCTVPATVGLPDAVGGIAVHCAYSVVSALK